METRKMILIIIASLLAVYAVILSVMSIIFLIKKKNIKSMWVSYSAWFIIIPPLLFPLLYSKPLFQVILLALSIFSFSEYAKNVGLWKDKYYMALCYTSIAMCYIPVFLEKFGFFQVLPVYLIVFVLLMPVLRGEYEHMIQKASLAMLGVAYFGWFFAHIGFLLNTDNGVAYVFLLFILVETNDASSYISGKLFGRKKLIRKISPKKTNEGFIGGLLATMLLSFLLKSMAPNFSVFHRVLFSLVISVGGTCGDLVMSFIKRDLGIKDFSKLLPGHGGLLDRFDSIIFVAPIFFHLVNNFYGLA